MSIHIEILNREFKRRVSKNGRYSMRAYANSLGLHPSALSRVLSGKWDLTPSAGVRVAKKLQLDHEERIQFIRSVLELKTAKETIRIYQAIGSSDAHSSTRKSGDDGQVSDGATMAVDPKKIGDARRQIRDFIVKLTGDLDCGELKQVYRLDVKLSPHSK